MIHSIPSDDAIIYHSSCIRTSSSERYLRTGLLRGDTIKAWRVSESKTLKSHYIFTVDGVDFSPDFKGFPTRFSCENFLP